MRFKYDVVELISAIRERPVIWDKSSESYKDKVERKNAWDEVCNILDNRFAHMTPADKIATHDQIINKWQNLRDTFRRSVKSKTKKTNHKYFMYNHMKFLLKFIPQDEINGDYKDGNDDGESFEQEEVEFEEYIPKKRTRTERRHLVKTEQQDNEYEDKTVVLQEDSQKSDNDDWNGGNIDFVEIDSKVESDPRVMNEDEAFFASLLPTVVKYNEDERLEFRILVLSAMKKIKDNRQFHS